MKCIFLITKSDETEVRTHKTILRDQADFQTKLSKITKNSFCVSKTLFLHFLIKNLIRRKLG